MTDRALFIVPTGSEPWLAAKHFATGLRDAGVECLLCDAGLASARSGESLGLSIHRARPWDVMAIGRLRGLIADFDPRVLYVMRGDADLFALAAATQFDCQIVLERATKLSKVEQLWGSTGVHLQTSSQAERRRLSELGCRTPLMTVLPSLPTSGKPLTKRQLTERLAIPEDSKLLGVVADFVSSDRLRDAIWVADLMKAVRDDTHLLIFGDGPEWLRLERYRRRLEIEDCVHFMGRPADVSTCLAALDAYWCAAGSDSIHYGMCAAMGLGIPLILSDTPGHRELVRNEEHGLLFPVGNRAHFGRQALRVLEEPQLAEHLSVGGKYAWQQHGQPQQSRDEFVACYVRIMHGDRMAA